MRLAESITCFESHGRKAYERNRISEQELLEAVDLFSKVEEVLTVAKREVTHQNG